MKNTTKRRVLVQATRPKILFLYQDLKYSYSQISDIAGVSISVIEGILSGDILPQEKKLLMAYKNLRRYISELKNKAEELDDGGMA